MKWRTFKIHFKTYESLWAPAQTYQFPRVYDVANDPGEVTNLMPFPTRHLLVGLRADENDPQREGEEHAGVPQH